MSKEILMIIIVTTVIILLEMMTSYYTSMAMDTMSETLGTLKEELLKKDKMTVEKSMRKVEEKWDQTSNTLACYIEHDELEKVETQIATLKGKIEVNKYEESIENIDTTIFILQHIEEKEKFSLQSLL